VVARKFFEIDAVLFCQDLSIPVPFLHGYVTFDENSQPCSVLTKRRGTQRFVARHRTSSFVQLSLPGT